MVTLIINGTAINKEFGVYDALDLIKAAKEANYIVEWMTPDAYENEFLWNNI